MPNLPQSFGPRPLPRQVVVFTAVYGSGLACTIAHQPHRPRYDATVDGHGRNNAVHLSRREVQEGVRTSELTCAALREPGLRLGYRALEHAGPGGGVQADVLAEGQRNRLIKRYEIRVTPRRMYGYKPTRRSRFGRWHCRDECHARKSAELAQAGA
jgi:hypothetical protein